MSLKIVCYNGVNVFLISGAVVVLLINRSLCKPAVAGKSQLL